MDSDSGLMLHQLESPTELAEGRTLSASIVHRTQHEFTFAGRPIPVYDGGTGRWGGVVLSAPPAVQIKCLYMQDATSSQIAGGCATNRGWCDEAYANAPLDKACEHAPDDDCQCCTAGLCGGGTLKPWRGSHLKQFLALYARYGGQEGRTIFPGHNEVVIEGGDTWEQSLPQAIEAFYYETRFEGAEAIARSLRDAFVTRHKLSAEAVPLLVLDRTDWDVPFSLAAAPPPPPTSPPPVTATDLATALNARFHRVPLRPDLSWASLADAGILLHVFDSWEDHAKPWHVADLNGPSISASLIFGAQRVPNEPIPIFANDEDRAGLIFRPGHTPVECAKAGDSAGKCDLGSWCPSLPPSSYPADPSGVAAWRTRMDTLAVEVDSIHVSLDGCGRAWRPADISAYLERTTAVQLHFQHLSYNEWIVGPPTAWEAALPELVEAFFVSANVKPELLARTQAWHQQFAAEYPEHAVPLVVLDAAYWEAPFGAAAS